MSDTSGQYSDNHSNLYTMIIKTIEYKFTESATFAPLTLRQGSALFQETPQQTNAGTLYLAEVSAYMPRINATAQAELTLLNNRPAIFQLTDTEGFLHTLGTNAEPATFSASKRIGPTPGVAYGYNIKITCLSVAGSKMTSFIS